ncbi:MAG: COX15/CtaA family protein [Alphaproteobacteria bacterium]|nr:COX15/CtaA family protein [Alphaproteobacteria bacterium]
MTIARSTAAQSPTPRQLGSRRSIAIWLFVVCGMIAGMVVLGGLTRLTGSGLSITEWKPIHGALPPLSQAEWQEEFAAYRAIPQYERINKGMTLDEFKGIFWWEWAHRNLGRLIGVAFLIPLLVFLFQGRIERALLPRLIGLFVLGGMQGALGWFMVMSGLKDRVDVSQYRLVAHLMLALTIYAALLWTALPLWRGDWPVKGAPHPLFRWSLGVLVLIAGQIKLGGFVAGLDAGLTYNTWPLLDGQVVPAGAFGTWLAPFEDIATVQFNHRIMAYIVTAAIVALWLVGRRQHLSNEASTTSHLLLAAVVLQVMLGIATLLAVVPISLAALHQLGAVVLLTAGLLHAFALRAPIK